MLGFGIGIGIWYLVFGIWYLVFVLVLILGSGIGNPHLVLLKAAGY